MTIVYDELEKGYGRTLSWPICLEELSKGPKISTSSGRDSNLEPQNRKQELSQVDRDDRVSEEEAS
jgi:hypothetical protein